MSPSMPSSSSPLPVRTGPAPRRVAVVGAGLGGLSAAHAIRRRARERGEDLELEVWEAADRPGGMLRTTVEDGFVVEWGANAFRSGVGPNADLVRRLGLAGDQVRADASANRRYVFHGGRLHQLPSDPVSLLTFEPMSKEGRLRILAEPFRAERVEHEETVHAYAARHIGPEAAEVLLGTMVRGVYGGDAHALSVDAAFPDMRRMEREHRSLVVAAIAGTRQRMREGKSTWSFRAGMNVIVDRLAEELGDALRLGRAVQDMAVDPCTGAYLLTGDDGVVRGFDAVVLAVAPEATARIVDRLDTVAATELAAIPSAPIAAVAMAFERDAFRTPPDGFGFLVAPGQDLPVLGVLNESNVFPGRAPDGTVLVRAIVGGVHQPPPATRSDAQLEGFALDAIDRAWGLAGTPVRTWIGRPSRGIPQYVVGHGARLARIEERLRRYPGLVLAGNAYHGIAVGKLVDDAERVADEVRTAAVAV